MGKITSYTALTATQPDDLLVIVDVHDTSMAPTGTDKKITVASLQKPVTELSPVVTALTDAATIAVNAALGNDFYVTLGGNRTMGAPSSPSDGQKITFEIIQDGTGSRTLTWTGGAGGYAFGSGSAPTLSTAAGATDQAAFRYSARKNAWLYLGTTGGFL